MMRQRAKTKKNDKCVGLTENGSSWELNGSLERFAHMVVDNEWLWLEISLAVKHFLYISVYFVH